MSFRKSNNLSQSSISLLLFGNDAAKEDSEPEESIAGQNQPEQIQINYTLNAVPAAVGIAYYLFTNHAVGISLSYFNRFFYVVL